MYTFQKLVTVSAIIGLGASSGTFIGGLLYPDIQDWRDITVPGMIGVIIGAQYAFNGIR
jgi:hypothetical protein